MPHITKNKHLDNYSEKIKSNMIDMVRNYSNNFENKQTLFNIIEEMLANTITTKMESNEFFDRFVEIKEVPYGERNINTNY